jgi:hypothetical protein
LAFEGALPVYDALDEMLGFTGECLLFNDIILQCCLFFSLGSIEVISALQVASIMSLSVVVPMRLFAGRTQKLAHCRSGANDQLEKPLISSIQH